MFFSKSEERRSTIKVPQWLESVEPTIIKECEGKVYSYRKKIGLIDNNIKHNTGRYKHLEMIYTYRRVLGYYVDSIDTNEVVQADEEIHPKFHGVGTAISYNRDLRELIVNIYLIAYEFSKAIRRIIKKKYGKDLSVKKCIKDDNERILEVFQRIDKLDSYFFIDEYEKLPQIILSKDIIKLRKKAYSSYVNKLLKPIQYTINAAIELEDECKHAIPYMDGKTVQNFMAYKKI